MKFLKSYLLLLVCGVVKDVIHPNHLGKNGAIAERVAQCSQPGSDIAQCSHNLWVGGGDDEEICIYVQDDGPTPYQVVQFGAAHTYQPGGKNTLHIRSLKKFGSYRTIKVLPHSANSNGKIVQ